MKRHEFFSAWTLGFSGIARVNQSWIRLQRARKNPFVFLCLSVLVIISITFAVSILWPHRVSALTTVPTKMNFQGHLTDDDGDVLADGSYNMRLRLFTAASGGSAVWTEDRLVSTADGVEVSNGLFSIRLGDISALSSSLFGSGDLYLEVELPTPGSATSSSPVWTEGAMTPRNQLLTSAYAYNAETLDGLDSAAFGQLAAANTFTQANTVQTTSTNAFSVQTSGGTSVLHVDTTNTIVRVASSATPTQSDVRLLTSIAEFTGSVRVGNATNRVDISSSGISFGGTARPTRTITLAPEYPGATFTAVGGDNDGTLTSDFCSHSSLLNVNSSACSSSGDEHNYYAWTTTQASAQKYDIYVRYRIPADYDTDSMTNLRIWGWGTTSASEIVSLGLYKTNSTACGSITNAITGNTTWNEATLASPLGSCTINAGDLVTFRVRVTAGQNKVARAGEIRFDYRGKF